MIATQSHTITRRRGSRDVKSMWTRVSSAVLAAIYISSQEAQPDSTTPTQTKEQGLDDVNITVVAFRRRAASSNIGLDVYVHWVEARAHRDDGAGYKIRNQKLSSWSEPFYVFPLNRSTRGVLL